MLSREYSGRMDASNERPELVFRADLLALNAVLTAARDENGGAAFLDAARHLRQFAAATTPEAPSRRTAPIPFRASPSRLPRP